MTSVPPPASAQPDDLKAVLGAFEDRTAVVESLATEVTSLVQEVRSLRVAVAHRPPRREIERKRRLTGVAVAAWSLALIFALTLLASAGAQTRATTAQHRALKVPTMAYEKYKFPNGLEVILLEDHRLPLTGVDLWYHVGPLNERPGRTGFAHLFEHMMFQGSKHVGEKSHFKFLEAAGARPGAGINGTTDFDRTNYFETVPSDQLELALWLESDRMGFLLDTLDATKLANQRDVVRNERRQGIENQPYGLVDEAVTHQLYPKGHPYYAYVIGSHADVEAARLNDVRSHLAELEADSEIAGKQLEEITREHQRLEGETGILDQKISREEQRLFSGGVSNPKELSALQAEVAMLKRKKSDLEDGLLEVMVQKDDAASTLESLESERSELSAEAESLREAVGKLTGEIDSELESHRSKRTEVAGSIPGDLLSLYERVRASKGGVGAAALVGGTCQGCHTKLPAKEAERLRSERGLQRCENCGRILVVQ